MKNLIMAMIMVGSTALATAPAFAVKAPVAAAKTSTATCCSKAKAPKISHKPTLKNKEQVVGLKKTK